MAKKLIPENTAGLLEYLDECYPARPPNPNDPEREIWMKAGARRLVESLKIAYERQVSSNV